MPFAGRKHGGSDALANLALAHRSCNQAKGAASYRHPLDSADKPDDRDDYQHEQQDPDDPAAADRDIRETHGDSVAIVPDVTRAAAP